MLSAPHAASDEKCAWERKHPISAPETDYKADYERLKLAIMEHIVGNAVMKGLQVRSMAEKSRG